MMTLMMTKKNDDILKLLNLKLIKLLSLSVVVCFVLQSGHSKPFEP